MISFRCSSVDTLSEGDAIRAGYYLENDQVNLKRLFLQKQAFIKEKTTRFVLSVELIILFLIGASFGYCYNDQKPFLLIVLGLYTISFFYGTIIGIERMSTQDLFGNAEGTIITMIMLIAATLIFIIKGIKKEKKKTWWKSEPTSPHGGFPITPNSYKR